MPVIISPTGVQAVHPQGELAVARAAANRGIPMGLSSFASKSVEDVAQANASTFFQLYWSGDRDTLAQRVERARNAGAKGIIVTLDWSFSNGRGSPRRSTWRQHSNLHPRCWRDRHGCGRSPRPADSQI
jgi:isopentenyl diphosphate isomerase/L-lactate dehydrogenase-like FMN-dependent dehydrogenase